MKGGGRGGGHSRASGGERSRSQTQHRRRQLCTFCQPSIRGVGGAFVETVSESELRAADTTTRNPKASTTSQTTSPIQDQDVSATSVRERGREEKEERGYLQFCGFLFPFLRVCCGFAKKTHFSAFVFRFFPPFFHGVHFKGRGNALLLCLDKEKLLSAALRATSFVRFSGLR